MATGKRVQPRPKKKAWKKALITIAILLVLVTAMYLFLVYTNNAFVSKWRTIYIETAMSTMRHQWLATALLPPSVVQKVVDDTAAVLAEQAEAVSSWDTVDPSAQAAGLLEPTAQPEPVYSAPPDTQPEPVYSEQPDTSPELTPQEQAALEKEEQERLEREAQEAEAARQQAIEESRATALYQFRSLFYSIYSELDPVAFDTFLMEHPGYYEDGYGGIVIEDLDHELGLKTIYDEDILVIDVPNNLVLLGITGDNYVGKLAIVKNAKQVYLEPAEDLGFSSFGTKIEDFGTMYNALIAMNGSGFDDPNGEGWGGYVVGTYIAHTKGYTNALAPTYKTFGYRKDYRLYIENPDTFIPQQYLWAMQFSPALIIDGEVLVNGTNGMGMQPRSAVGQTQDGSFLMLAIDGRQVGYSIGATMEDCALILQKHGAYQAINLDGGSSTVMAYKGKLITKPSSVTSFGRYLPNAFIIHRADDIPEF